MVVLNPDGSRKASSAAVVTLAVPEHEHHRAAKPKAPAARNSGANKPIALHRRVSFHEEIYMNILAEQVATSAKMSETQMFVRQVNHACGRAARVVEGIGDHQQSAAPLEVLPLLAQLFVQRFGDLDNAFQFFDDPDIEEKSAVELSQFVVSMQRLNPSLSSKQISALFTLMDANYDNSLSYTEFMVALDGEKMLEPVEGFEDPDTDLLLAISSLLLAETECALGFHELTSVPPWVLSISTLSKLTLCDNEIEALPANIGHALPSLETLNVGGNHISLNGLPESLGSLAALSLLDVSDNQLTTLPDCLLKCSKLSVLVAHHNRLHVLPDRINTLPSLQLLDVSNNLLSTLPSTDPPLPPTVTSLNLSSCCFNTLPATCLSLRNIHGAIMDKNPGPINGNVEARMAWSRGWISFMDWLETEDTSAGSPIDHRNSVHEIRATPAKVKSGD